MSKTKPRILLSLLAVILCISIFPVTAFASGGDYHDYELPPPESTEAEKTEEAETEYTGTVTTNGGNLNVRTGAGMDNKALALADFLQFVVTAVLGFSYLPSARPPRVRATTFLPCNRHIYRTGFGQHWTLC